MPSDPVERRFMLCTGRVVKYSDLHKFASSHIHILGDLRYLTDEGRRVTSLALWEVSTPSDQVLPVKPEIVTYMIGDNRLIRCRHGVGTPARCKNSQRWEIGKEGFRALLDRNGMTALMDKMGLLERYKEVERQESHE